MNRKGDIVGNYFDISLIDIDECSDDRFILDTNALLWAFYPNSQSNNQVAAYYSNFISQLITKEKQIYIPMFNLCEAINVIEKIEFKIYRQSCENRNLKLKEYRAVFQERQNLKGTLELFIEQLESIPQITILRQDLCYSLPKVFINKFDKHTLDLFDVLLVEISNTKKCSVITDDKDFLSAQCESNIYTCNQNILSHA